MKKIALITLALIGLIGFTNAQTVDFGIKGGYMYSDIETEDISTDLITKGDSENGYYIGAFARIGKDKWFLQPELQYRERKATVTVENALVSGDYGTEVKVKTLDVPLLVGRQLIKLPAFTLRAHAGPVASLKLSDDTKILGLDETVEDTFADPDYKSFIWGGQIGISADVWKITADIAYEKGFSDISDDILGKNDLIFLSVGFKIF